MIKVTVDTRGYNEKAFVCRLKYVLDFIQNHPCAPEGLSFDMNNQNNSDITISYSDKKEKYQIVPQYIFFEKSENRISILKEFDFEYNGYIIKGFCNNGGSGFIAFDIFETIFFHISRYEEWYAEPKQMDMHGTMASKEQYLVKNGLHSFPVVDKLVLFFFEKFGLLPKQVETTFSMSHDIDVLKKYPSFYKFLRGYGNILFFQPNKWRKMIRHTINYWQYVIEKKPEPYDSFEWLLIKDNPKISQKTIYWLVGGNTQYEGYFSICDPKVKSIIEKARNCGYETGLHPSYDTIDDMEMMRKEWELLCNVSSESIFKGRQHFLRFDIKKTGKLLDELGLKTDSSLGYRDRIGFRCGTGFPYHLYDFDSENAYCFVETPLIVMDISALRDSVWDSEKWGKLISDFIEKNKFNTHITFNFHNSFFDPVMVNATSMKEWYIKTFH